MKRLLIISSLVMFSLLSGSFVGNFVVHYNVFGQDLQNNQIFASPLPSPSQIRPSIPVYIEIPKIGINTNIEQVGLETSGKMGVPEGIENVGWYSLGTKPGEKGNAVIDGHLDTITGAPAVFYYLNKLEPGDLITVTDINNKKFVFNVTDKKSYEFNIFPLQDIFGESDASRLNLITCEGYFDRRSQNYSHRTVIFSELIEQI